MKNLVALTKENFKKTIESNAFLIVDFWAPWCEPCVNFTPIFEEAAKKNKDIIFGMVNTEQDPEIGEYFQVEKIPGLLVIRDRAGIHAQVGLTAINNLVLSNKNFILAAINS